MLDLGSDLARSGPTFRIALTTSWMASQACPPKVSAGLPNSARYRLAYSSSTFFCGLPAGTWSTTISRPAGSTTPLAASPARLRKVSFATPWLQIEGIFAQLLHVLGHDRRPRRRAPADHRLRIRAPDLRHLGLHGAVPGAVLLRSPRAGSWPSAAASSSSSPPFPKAVLSERCSPPSSSSALSGS